MPKKLNIKIGDVFNRWTVISEVQRNGKSTRQFSCKCSCGSIRIVGLDRLRSGASKSCGCYKRQRTSEIRSTHGMSRTKLYFVWHSMKRRCTDSRVKEYKNYGGRGIKICEDWLDSSKFIEWAISSGYQKGLTIERKDNDGDYCPENCTWIPKAKQPLNARSNHLIAYDGKTQCIEVWARELGIAATTIRSRHKKGLPPDKCLSQKIRGK